MASSRRAKDLFKHGKKVVTSLPITKEVAQPVDSDQQMPLANPGKPEKQQKRTQPNAFLSLRIMNQQILDHATEIQKQIIESNSLLSQASVAIPTLHITLMVFALKNDEDKQRAKQCLIDACQQIGLAKLPPPQITFSGLSTFNNTVLFMDPVKDAHFDVLTRMAEICREIYEKNGIISTDVRAFNPHLTLFKLSKAPRLYRKGVKKFDPIWSTKFAGQHFGIENIRTLQLCSMTQKQTDGYYHTYHEQELFDYTNTRNAILPPSNIIVNGTPESEELTDVDSIVISSSKMVKGTSNVEVVIGEPTECDTTVVDESSRLLGQDPGLHENAFSGIAAFFPSSCCKESSCCSLV